VSRRDRTSSRLVVDIIYLEFHYAIIFPV
jgi:hypothetical protein